MRRSLLWMCAGLLTLSAASARGTDAEAERFQVRAARVDGDWRCSIYAERAPLRDVLVRLARQCDMVVEGFEHVSRTALVDADLRDRPVRQALDYVLGSVGLRVEPRVGTWRISESTRAPTSAEELRTQATGALLAALRDFPDHPNAADALLAQGQLELSRDHQAAAAAHFDTLVERFPESGRVPEALLRAGLAMGQLQQWTDAADRYADLLRLEMAHPYEREARLELARATVWRGDARAALVMLDALESIDPVSDTTRRRARDLVRTRALLESGREREALLLLDQVERSRLTGLEALQAYELRGRGLEALGQPADAARAWLAFAESASGNERTIGLRHAARLALESGEELSVLFIARMAAGDPAEAELEALAQQARERLALFSTSPKDASLVERLERGEELLATGQFREARDALAVLGLSRARLDDDELLRFALAYGRALQHTDGVDEAVNVLRDLLAELELDAARREIYLLVGELYEEVGRLDEAVEAYQGRL